jgi:hypothetical protein
MNNLQNKQLQSGQSMINLVKHGQNKPNPLGLGEVRRRRVPGGPFFFVGKIGESGSSYSGF